MDFTRQSIYLSSSQHSYNLITSQTSHPFLSVSPPPISNVADRPELIPGKIDVWYACVDCSPKEIRKFETVISTEEKARSQRFRLAQDRERYIVQHGILRSLLCGYVGIGSRQVDIRTSVNGKPYLAGPDRDVIHFSASQSGAFAAFAFSRVGRIGVDIEKMRDIPDMLEIVEQHFTPREKHAIFCGPESLSSGLFYKLWTRKEAVLKAQGEGLLRPLDCVDVTTNRDANGPWKVQVAGGLIAEDFWVMDVNGPEGFATAVASAVPYDEKSITERWVKIA